MKDWVTIFEKSHGKVSFAKFFLTV